jgi:cysteinyl-tRNA synthetase
LDKIIDAGFSGVYLDIIDGYEYWQSYIPKSKRRKFAATDMAKFVIQISNYARNTRGIKNFVVVPQNGSGIINEISDSLKVRYLNSIDAIGVEDTFYYGNKDENNKLAPQQDVLENLKSYLSEGKKVLAIDYLTNETKIKDFVVRSCDAGLIPQVSVRDLNSLAAQKVSGCD